MLGIVPVNLVQILAWRVDGCCRFVGHIPFPISLQRTRKIKAYDSFSKLLGKTSGSWTKPDPESAEVQANTKQLLNTEKNHD